MASGCLGVWSRGKSGMQRWKREAEEGGWGRRLPGSGTKGGRFEAQASGCSPRMASGHSLGVASGCLGVEEEEEGRGGRMIWGPGLEDAVPG